MDRRFQLCLVALLFLNYADAHTLHLGRTCPDIQAYPNLSLNKVLGEWYVVYKTDTDNTCLIWNITKSPVDDEQIFVTEKRQLSFLDLVGVDHTHTVTAKAKIPNIEIPSKMRILWPGSITGLADFIVFDTDYDKYMAIFECNRAGLLHRRSVVILSKKSHIDHMFVRRVQRLLETAEVSHESLDKIDHNVCKAEGKHNWKVGSTDVGSDLSGKRGDGVVEYDISEIEIIGDDVAEDEVGSFRGSIKTSDGKGL